MTDTQREAIEMAIIKNLGAEALLNQKLSPYEIFERGWRAATDQAKSEKAELVKAARALVDGWHTPKWKDEPHTGEFIAKLEALLPEE